MRLMLAATLVFILVVFSDLSDCEAQIFRGRFRNAASHAPMTQPAMQNFRSQRGHLTAPSQPHRFPTQSYFETRNPVISRILDGKMTYQYRDPAEMDSRYMGGHHRSLFENIGIPPGDIGIRGNAYNWRTW